MKREIYIFSDGKIKRKDNTILFETIEGKNIYSSERLIIFGFGKIDLNKSFLDFISQKNICLHFSTIMATIVGASILENISIWICNIKASRVLLRF